MCKQNVEASFSHQDSYETMLCCWQKNVWFNCFLVCNDKLYSDLIARLKLMQAFHSWHKIHSAQFKIVKLSHQWSHLINVIGCICKFFCFVRQFYWDFIVSLIFPQKQWSYIRMSDSGSSSKFCHLALQVALVSHM